MRGNRVQAATVVLLWTTGMVLAAPPGTAFTYQGQLKRDGVPPSDTVPMGFSLWNAEANGAKVAPDINDDSVEVVNGLFAVRLDFGASAFTGEGRWLEIAVDGTPLSPRQPLTPTPYALHALNVPAPSNWLNDGDHVVLPTGNVGIGTNQPTAMLHLQRPYASTAMRFQSLRFDQGAPASLVRAPNSAANSGIGATWSNPGNALSTNDAWATTDLSEVVGTPDADQSGFLDLSAAAFSIPAAGQVTGITVQIEGHAAAGCSDCETAAVVVSAELLGGSAPSSTRSVEFGPSDAVFATGGSVDPWGLDWTPAQVNSAGFGVRLSANLVVGELLCVFGSCGIIPCDCTGTGTSFVDAVTITVFYFEAPSTSTPVHWSLGVSQEDANFRIAATPDLSSPIFVVTPQGSLGIGTTEFLNGFFKLAVNGPAAKPNGGQWSALSDARVKRNVEPLHGALERMLSLRGVTFEFTEEGLRTGLATPGRKVGLIAQEVEAVLPDWVDETPSGYKFVTEYGTTALLVEALRELRAEKNGEITELRHRLERLEAMLERVNSKGEGERP